MVEKIWVIIGEWKKVNWGCQRERTLVVDRSDYTKSYWWNSVK